MSRAIYRGCGSKTRRGAAVAELAICLPLLVLLIFASIEACSMIFLDHGLSIASYEGVRAAINYDGTNADVTARCNEIINQRSIASATVSTNPGNVTNVERGQPITVTVTAPSDANMISPPWFFGGMTLTARTTMVKE
jgi:Flp pilus assembly protein TadG